MWNTQKTALQNTSKLPSLLFCGHEAAPATAPEALPPANQIHPALSKIQDVSQRCHSTWTLLAPLSQHWCWAQHGGIQYTNILQVSVDSHITCIQNFAKIYVLLFYSDLPTDGNVMKYKEILMKLYHTTVCHWCNELYESVKQISKTMLTSFLVWRNLDNHMFPSYQVLFNNFIVQLSCQMQTYLRKDVQNKRTYTRTCFLFFCSYSSASLLKYPLLFARAVAIGGNTSKCLLVPCETVGGSLGGSLGGSPGGF